MYAHRKNKQNPSLGSWLFRTSAFEQQLRKAKFCHLRFLAVLSRLMHAHRKANWIRAWVSCSLQHACCMHSCSPVAESLWRGGTWEWKTEDIIETYLVEFLCAYWTSLLTRSLARNFDRRPTVHDCAIDESGVIILCYGKWKRGNLGWQPEIDKVVPKCTWLYQDWFHRTLLQALVNLWYSLLVVQ